MKTRSFTQQYGYIAVLLVLAFVCAVPLFFVHAAPVVRNNDDVGDTWQGWVWVMHEGGHLSGNMAISTTWHDWGIRNTLPDLDEDSKKDNTVTFHWECQNAVTKEFGHRIPWDEMKRLGSVTIPAGEYREYQYGHLANTCDWIAEPGNYTLSGYTSLDIPKDKARKGVNSGTAVQNFTID